MIGKLFKKKTPEEPKDGQSMIFEAQIGGYYTYKDQDGKWGVFRMLDFAGIAVHCALYKDHFDHKPTLKQVQALTPAIMHAPLHKASLFEDKELTLLGATPLKGEDLMGLVTYLEHFGATEKEIEESVARIGGLSRQGKVRLKLTKEGPEVKAEELED